MRKLIDCILFIEQLSLILKIYAIVFFLLSLIINRRAPLGNAYSFMQNSWRIFIKSNNISSTFYIFLSCKFWIYLEFKFSTLKHVISLIVFKNKKFDAAQFGFGSLLSLKLFVNFYSYFSCFFFTPENVKRKNLPMMQILDQN